MRLRPNPFETVSLALGNDPEPSLPLKWFAGANDALIREGIFNMNGPPGSAVCPGCGEHVMSRGGLASCANCGRSFEIDPEDVARCRFDGRGMADFIRRELGLRNMRERPGYYSYLDPNGGSVYFVPVLADIDCNGLPGKGVSLVIYGSPGPGQPPEGSFSECHDIASVFELRDDGTIDVNRGVLGRANTELRGAVTVSGRLVCQIPRRALLAKLVAEKLAACAADGTGLDGFSEADLIREFMPQIEAQCPGSKASTRNLERDIQSMLGKGKKPQRDEDFAANWEALTRGEAIALDRVKKKVSSGLAKMPRGAPPPYLLASIDANRRPDGGYASEPVDPHTTEEFYDGIDRRL